MYTPDGMVDIEGATDMDLTSPFGVGLAIWRNAFCVIDYFPFDDL
jgi:hypothetical protein